MSILVLLVDDSRAMRDYVTAILERHGGYIVDEVSNGFDALRALPRANYDLIITDINMPDVSGIELARFVRQTKRHAETPIVAISTDASVSDQSRARTSGVTRFLAKPFTADELLAVTRELGDGPGGGR
ncbi:MAG: response regulator [Nannocystaceae bacterium]